MNPSLTPSSNGIDNSPPATSHSSNGRTMKKKRARQACVTCHSRKVKCDVANQGVPCTNCREDDVHCVIRQRARRNSKKDARNAQQQQQQQQPQQQQEDEQQRQQQQPKQQHQQQQPQRQQLQQNNHPLRPPQPPEGPINPGIDSFRQQLEEMPIQQPNYLPQDRSHLGGNGSIGGMSNGNNSRNIYTEPSGSTPYSSNLNQPLSFDSPLSAYRDPTGSWTQSPGQYNMFDDTFMTELLGQSLNAAYDGMAMDGNMTLVPGGQNNGQSAIVWSPGRTETQMSESQSGMSHFDQPQYQPSTSGISPQASAWQQVDPPGILAASRTADDIEFLQKQGSLSFPVMRLLRQFVEAYFLYAHPAIPMLLEEEFENLWNDTATDNRSIAFGSLFVLQAVLFASSSFAPDEVISECGFSSARDARGIFYRRAKLIFDFDGEQDPFNTARGALLLAYQGPNNNVRRVNCFWLNQAIRSARISDADLWYSKSELDEDQRRRLKRLWWSCVIRDRVLPLGVRRPVQITVDSFDWTRGDPLSEDDFLPEIKRSRVYDEITQHYLARVHRYMCLLAKSLSYAIPAAFPIDRNVKQIYDGEEYFNKSRSSIQHARTELLQWYDEAIVEFPVPVGLGDLPPAVVLFTNLMYIYYLAGMVALYHREALLLVYRASKEKESRKEELQAIHDEVLPAITDMTERAKEIVHLKMAKYLPISAAAYLTLPWVMHILDSKFAYTKSSAAVKQRRLKIFEDMINDQKRKFDGIEYVTGMVGRLSDYIDREVVKIKDSVSTPVQSWHELLVSHPRFYLRICVFIDLAFSKGEFPLRMDQEV